jgi:hypothetical protein
MPMGVKKHLVGLQQISADHKSPTVRQLDMGDLCPSSNDLEQPR